MSVEITLPSSPTQAIPNGPIKSGNFGDRSSRSSIVSVCRVTGRGFANETRSDQSQSCRTMLSRVLLILRPPLYSMNPSFLNLFMKKFTRERVAPIISASVS